MKKEKFALTVLATLLSINIVSAQDQFLGQVLDFINKTITAFIRIILAVVVPLTGIEGSPEFLIAKVLFFFVLLAIIFISLKNIDIFDDNKWALIIVTFTVSVFSIRYLPDAKIIEAILLPYSAFGATIGILLPLLAMFFFINFISPNSTFLRRLLWFVYGSFYVILWYQRYDNGAITSDIISWIYIIGFIFILANILFDSYMRSRLDEGKYREVRNRQYKARALEHEESARLARNKDRSKEASYFDRLARKLRRKIK